MYLVCLPHPSEAENKHTHTQSNESHFTREDHPLCGFSKTSLRGTRKGHIHAKREPADAGAKVDVGNSQMYWVVVFFHCEACETRETCEMWLYKTGAWRREIGTKHSVAVGKFGSEHVWFFCKGTSIVIWAIQGRYMTLPYTGCGYFPQKRVCKAMAPGPAKNVANATMIGRENRQTEVLKVKGNQQRWCGFCGVFPRYSPWNWHAIYMAIIMAI